MYKCTLLFKVCQVNVWLWVWLNIMTVKRTSRRLRNVGGYNVKICPFVGLSITGLESRARWKYYSVFSSRKISVNNFLTNMSTIAKLFWNKQLWIRYTTFKFLVYFVLILWTKNLFGFWKVSLKIASLPSEFITDYAPEKKLFYILHTLNW